jgi:DNA-directed RNA polymerase specialized sigma subunit
MGLSHGGVKRFSSKRKGLLKFTDARELARRRAETEYLTAHAELAGWLGRPPTQPELADAMGLSYGGVWFFRETHKGLLEFTNGRDPARRRAETEYITAHAELAGRLGRPPTMRELADAMGLSYSRVVRFNLKHKGLLEFTNDAARLSAETEARYAKAHAELTGRLGRPPTKPELADAMGHSYVSVMRFSSKHNGRLEFTDARGLTRQRAKTEARYATAHAELAVRLGRPPTTAELADAMGLSYGSVRHFSSTHKGLLEFTNGRLMRRRKAAPPISPLSRH